MKSFNSGGLNKRFAHTILVAPLAVGLGLIALPGVSQAQPDLDNAPKGDNPAGRQGGRPDRGGQRPDFRNMTPEQRQQMQQQMQQQRQERRQEGIRRNLTGAGIVDQATQDAVIAFAEAQDQTRDPLQEKTRQLSIAIRDGATDEQIAVLLAALRVDAQATKTQREAALKDLDAKIGYTNKPKLEAVLTLMGITGDEGAGLGGRGMGGPGMGGGREGMGGGQFGQRERGGQGQRGQGQRDQQGGRGNRGGRTAPGAADA